MGYFDNSLQHHGILGQKWGVRRFETESGHLTAAGKNRYNTDADGNYKKLDSAKKNTASAKEALAKAKQKAANSGKTSDYKALNKAKGFYDLRKKQESDTKTRIKMDGKKITKHQQKLIEKFKEKGMSQEEAEVAAYKRARLERTLAIAGTVTVAAAAAYGAKKYHDYVTDEVLEVGNVSMKRVTRDNSNNLYDTFYAATGKSDQNKYVGLYGSQVKQESGGGDVYQKTIKLKENIKIASDKNAKDTMSEIMKNTSDQNRREILSDLKAKKDIYDSNPMLKGTKQGRMITKGYDDIKAGRYDTKAAYDALNYNMTNGNQAKVYGEFKQALKDKGYSGIKDRNDASYSGYNAKTARIIFDASKVKVSDVRKLSDYEIDENRNREMLKVMTKMSLPSISGYAAIGAALGGAGYATSKSNRAKENTKAISDYKKKHPDTKLSNDEILENYYGGK